MTVTCDDCGKGLEAERHTVGAAVRCIPCVKERPNAIYDSATGRWGYHPASATGMIMRNVLGMSVAEIEDGQSHN